MSLTPISTRLLCQTATPTTYIYYDLTFVRAFPVWNNLSRDISVHAQTVLLSTPLWDELISMPFRPISTRLLCERATQTTYIYYDLTLVRGTRQNRNFFDQKPSCRWSGPSTSMFWKNRTSITGPLRIYAALVQTEILKVMKEKLPKNWKRRNYL